MHMYDDWFLFNCHILVLFDLWRFNSRSSKFKIKFFYLIRIFCFNKIFFKIYGYESGFNLFNISNNKAFLFTFLPCIPIALVSYRFLPWSDLLLKLLRKIKIDFLKFKFEDCFNFIHLKNFSI